MEIPECSRKLISQKPVLREKIREQGSCCLSDTELIAILLRTGTRAAPVMKLSAEVLKILEDSKPEEALINLSHIPGMGTSKISVIAAALELGKRRHGARGAVIRKPQDIIPFISHFASKKQEHFLCASLNGAHEIQEIRVVTIGILNKTVIHPREVFADPLTDRAAAIIICHNHPSGQLTPSSQDMDITRRIHDAGELLGIPMLDHIIITDKGFYSFTENGIFGTQIC